MQCDEQGGSQRGKEGQKVKDDRRMYKCSRCGKSYLSYPALYTHTKIKHLQPGETPSITNGRMRGRPRKNMARESLIV
jgi:hypothetical protein